MMATEQARQVLGEGYKDQEVGALLKAMYAIADLEWTVFNQSNQQTHAT